MASSINSLPGTNGRKSIFQKRPCIHFNHKDSLTIGDFFVKNEKEWINAHFCGICSRVFDKLKGIFKHHWFFNKNLKI